MSTASSTPGTHQVIVIGLFRANGVTTVSYVAQGQW
jgi:hypothetical protein